MRLVKERKGKRKVYYDAEKGIVRKVYSNKTPQEIKDLTERISICFPEMLIESGEDYIDIHYVDAPNAYAVETLDKDAMIDFWYSEFSRILQNDIIYCDWNAENTLVLEDGFKLVDYDSLYDVSDHRLEKAKLSFIHHASKFNKDHPAIDYVDKI